MTDKTALRRGLLFRGQTQMPALNAVHASAIAATALNLLQCDYKNARMIGVYYPMPDELDSKPLILLLRDHDYDIALPLVTGRIRPLSFRHWLKGQKIHLNARGLAQPPWNAAEITPDVIIVPVVGFNAELYRIGRGGGHYDRTLAMLPDAATIGLAYTMQKTSFTPEPHDRPLDCLVTETGVRNPCAND